MGKCEETAGFLISAPCRKKSELKCRTCGKAICQTHTRPSDKGEQCIACHRKAGTKYERDTDDPMLYSAYRYNDFYALAHTWGRSEDDRGYFDSDNPSSQHDYGASGSEDDTWENDFDGS